MDIEEVNKGDECVEVFVNVLVGDAVLVVSIGKDFVGAVKRPA